jgi:hypothetical protein
MESSQPASGPTLDRWRSLYEAAQHFKEGVPWRWMDNADLFAVENPADGQTGYCTVMGAGGEEFGLGIFLGDEGFRAYLQLWTDPETDAFEVFASARSLSATFVDRSDLEKRDRDVIGALGLKFRGRQAWPLFRSQWPGYWPWFLTDEEIAYLTLALRHAVAVAEEVRCGNVDLQAGLDANRVLTVCFPDGKPEAVWRELPGEHHPEPEPRAPADEVRMARLAARERSPQEAWEVDLFRFPVAVGEKGERPAYARVLLAVEGRHGLIVGVRLLGSSATADEYQEEFVRMLEGAPAVPGEIRVNRRETANIVTPVARALGVPVSLARTPLLDEAKESMFDHLGPGR